MIEFDKEVELVEGHARHLIKDGGQTLGAIHFEKASSMEAGKQGKLVPPEGFEGPCLIV